MQGSEGPAGPSQDLPGPPWSLTGGRITAHHCFWGTPTVCISHLAQIPPGRVDESPSPKSHDRLQHASVFLLEPLFLHL